MQVCLDLPEKERNIHVTECIRNAVKYYEKDINIRCADCIRFDCEIYIRTLLSGVYDFIVNLDDLLKVDLSSFDKDSNNKKDLWDYILNTSPTKCIHCTARKYEYMKLKFTTHQ